MQLVLRYVLALLAGWVASDVYNEYQDSRNAIVAAQQATRKNFFKWVLNTVIAGILFFIIYKILIKLKIIKS